jgi:hypothetical protein
MTDAAMVIWVNTAIAATRLPALNRFRISVTPQPSLARLYGKLFENNSARQPNDIPRAWANWDTGTTPAGAS